MDMMASNMDAITVSNHLFFTDMDGIQYFIFFLKTSMESEVVCHICFAQKFLISQIINLQYPHIICCCNFAQNTPNVSTINQQSL